jgi:hypothetical protein|tara:strand:+ start:2034 stop:2309 length:276 start_codon:yes stop_codon:yes gene_type:complete
MSEKTTKFKIGDLVTRTYRAYTLGDPLLNDDRDPQAPQFIKQPYGIVIEVRESTNAGGPPNVLVYWFKDAKVYTNAARLNNARFLRLINRA